MLCRALLAAVAFPTAMLAVPASAGGVTTSPYGAFGTCVSLAFDRPTTAVGELSAMGLLTGPGTITLPVADVRPVEIVGATSWSGCAGGGYPGASFGAVVVSLVVSGPDGDLMTSSTCTVVAGAVTCS